MEFNYGKHKGRAIEDVPSSYLLWVYQNLPDLDPQIRDYIKTNLRALRLERRMDQAERDKQF